MNSLFENLAVKIENFISEKQGLGYRYIREERLINNFHRFVMNTQNPCPVSEDSIIQWVDSSASEVYRNQKIAVIRQFALYLNRIGETAYIVPVAYRSIERNDFIPHIYSKKELALIFMAADNHGKYGKLPYSNLSFPLVLRMLYGCGLRISEALSLKVKSVDLVNGILKIKDTKFFKDRLIPMHKNLTRRCVIYAQAALAMSAPDDFFFPPVNIEQRISNAAFNWYFKKLLKQSGIQREDTNRGFRVHDMRHTFAVHCLQKLDCSGMDMAAVLPILATYMGHTSYIGTGTYLHLTSELYPEIINKVNDVYSVLIPQGGIASEN
jgi:integrase